MSPETDLLLRAIGVAFAGLVVFIAGYVFGSRDRGVPA